MQQISPMCAKRVEVLFCVCVWGGVMWCIIAVNLSHRERHTLCWHHSCEQHVFSDVFPPCAANKADWTWKHQCVHSTCHRAVEAGVSASWYRGTRPCRGPWRSTNAPCFSRSRRAHRDRQADYTQRVTSGGTCTQSQSEARGGEMWSVTWVRSVLMLPVSGGISIYLLKTGKWPLSRWQNACNLLPITVHQNCFNISNNFCLENALNVSYM